MPSKLRLPRGITRTATGYRARLRVDGEELSKRFPPDTPLETMTAWRRYTRDDAERHRLPRPPAGSFAADAREYLEAVKAMPSYADRARDINLWIAEFGDRPRSSITSVQIRTVRDRWLVSGPRLEQSWQLNPITHRKDRIWTAVAKPVSGGTVNLRLRALENLWTVLDGRHAPNPVREVPEADQSEGPPRALPVDLVRRILEHVREPLAGAWLRVLAWTGTPPATVARMNASLIDLEAGTAWIPGRKKGKKTKGRRVPLTPEGIEAFRAFVREDAFREHSPKGNMRRAWRAACHEVERESLEAGVPLDLSGSRVYDLRHSVGTLAHLTTGDLESTRQLLGVSMETARRYAAGALDPRLEMAVKKLAEAQAKPADK